MTPPHDLEAERHLLGALLTDADAALPRLNGLTPDAFHKPAHGRIYAAARALADDGLRVDAVTVADRLERDRRLDEVGGQAGVVDVVATTAVPDRAGQYAEIIERHHQRRQALQHAKALQKAATDGDMQRLQALMPETSAAPEKAEGNGRKVRLTPLAEIQPRPVRWTWTDRIPTGEVTLTPGRGGIGKSTFHAWLIAQITTGNLPGVHQGTPRACIIVAAEDSYERTIVPRLLVAGADPRMVYRADVVTEATEHGNSLSLPVDCQALEAEITRAEVALVSLDPLLSVVYGGIDTYKDREVREALEPLAHLADRTGAAILGNAHFNKGTGSDPLALIMGSSAFGNVARAALGFARDPEAEDSSCVISQIKNNLGRTDLPNLKYTIDPAQLDTPEGPATVGRLNMQGETDRSVGDILATPGGSFADDDTTDAASVLAQILSKGPLWVKQAMDAMADAGFSKDQAKGAKKKLKVRSEKFGQPGDAEQGWKWVLPDPRREPEGSEGSEVTNPTPLRSLRPPSTHETEATA